MSKKTPNEIKKEVNKLIKFGLSAQSIRSIIREETPAEDWETELLYRLVNDTIADHPSYPLIQKIMRSKLIVDKNSKEEKFYILDPTSTELDTIHRIRIQALFSKPDFTDRTYVCNFGYYPDKSDSLSVDDDGLWQYNLYRPPTWLAEHFGSETNPLPKRNDIPKLYEKFLGHLVNYDKSSYEYVLDWLANGMQDRNYCILTTIGNQGIGKGVLGDIMRELFGSTNFVKTECRILTKDFNKQILNKRMVYIDELKIKNSSEENKLKTLINDYIEIEGKGIDAIEIKNHASVYVSSNELDSIRLRGDDRRFSIVSLTEKKLPTIMSNDEIKSLFAADNIKEFAEFLMTRKVDQESIMRVFVSNRTEEVRSSSLKNWEEFFLDEICTEYAGRSLTISEITDRIENIFGSRCRPSRTALKSLHERYPEAFKLERKRDGNRRVWFVNFRREE